MIEEAIVLTEEEQPFWDEQYNNAMTRIMRGAALELRQPADPTDTEIAAKCADDAVRARRKRQGVPVELTTGSDTVSVDDLVFTEVRYGRTIELGEFGKRGKPHKKVWFGWTVERQEGQTEEEVMDLLHEKADEQEEREQELFDEENAEE